MHPILLTAAGHRRQPVTLPGYHAGRPPRNKGRRYPADPPRLKESSHRRSSFGDGVTRGDAANGSSVDPGSAGATVPTDRLLRSS